MPTPGFKPIAKPKRIENSRLWKAISALKYCEVCGRQTGVTHAHHIKSRGAGGGDERSNMIGCCPHCHDDAHRGKISRAVLMAIASAAFRHIPGYDDERAG